MPDDLKVRAYDVQPRLGRHMVLDPRSLAYRRPYTGEPLRVAEWEPRIPVLDQENLIAQGIRTSQLYPDLEAGDADALGSCTGNAGTAVLSVLLTPAQARTAGLDYDDPVAAEKWAIGLYSDATHRDQWNDSSWPVTDTGSSGLGVAKALKHRKLVDQYGHATTAHEVARDLQTGPLLLGLPWYEAWFEPGSSAFLDEIPAWDHSPLAGGHEVAVTALESVAIGETGRLIPEHTILRARNSWGPSWGDAGCFRFSLALYQQLRAQIDVIQPRIERTR